VARLGFSIFLEWQRCSYIGLTNDRCSDFKQHKENPELTANHLILHSKRHWDDITKCEGMQNIIY